ncbi:MAG: hypothetical protein D6B27_05950 [Gammaproteobacteria bacterium]|nr:MAG: hypothetical protein D6B27_05950 [Gammaproteobacteria bacterium]
MYEEFYKLKGNPFQLTPSASLFFGSKVHNQGFAYLQYGLKQAEGFIVITGEIGTGKTTLVERLFSVLEFGPVVASRIVTTQIDGNEMPFLVAASFGISTEGLSKTQVLHAIETFLKQKANEGKRVLLVIDEAQNLSLPGIEELRMLSNINHNSKPIMQCFMLGQVELRHLLAHDSMEQFRQRIIASCHLEPLTEKETEDYIMYRLIKCGWRSNPKFTSEAFELIYMETHGVPRRVNRLCDRLLLLGALHQLDVFDKEVVQTVVDELKNEMKAITGIESFSSLGQQVRPANSSIKYDMNSVDEHMEKAGTVPSKSHEIHVTEELKKKSEELVEAKAKIDSLEERVTGLERKIEYLHGMLVGRLGGGMESEFDTFQLKTFKPK